MSIEIVAFPINDPETVQLSLRHMTVLTRDNSPEVRDAAWKEIDRLLDLQQAIGALTVKHDFDAELEGLTDA